MRTNKPLWRVVELRLTYLQRECFTGDTRFGRSRSVRGGVAIYST
jgi:hypothetical protein